MKRKISAFALTWGLVQLVSAQTVVLTPHEEELAVNKEVVCEAGDLIQKEKSFAVPQTEDAAKPEIHFFEGFASESSEKALLSHVEKMMMKDPAHACEIVKEAIVISQADPELVAKIVETACLAAPEKMRIIAQCAMAACPDALTQIQMVLAKLDPATGDSAGSKSGITKGGLEKDGLEKGGVDKPSDPIVPLIPPIDITTPPPTLPPFPPTINPPPATPNHR
jgi:DNA-directed RNA polymerase subunit F